MNRPTRQHKHLVEKVASKTARVEATGRKPGKRTKRYKAWVEAYKPLAAE
jgi:hypothetical protein